MRIRSVAAALRWDVKPQPFHHCVSSFAFTAGLKPEQTKSERRVDSRLCLLLVHAHHGKGAAALPQQTAGVTGEKLRSRSIEVESLALSNVQPDSSRRNTRSSSRA